MSSGIGLMVQVELELGLNFDLGRGDWSGDYCSGIR